MPLKELISVGEQEPVLAEIDPRKKTGAARAAAIGVALAMTVLGAGLGAYYGKIKPDSDRDELAQQAIVREQDERNQKLRDEQSRLQQKIADAERQIFEEQKRKAIAMATAHPTFAPTAMGSPTAPPAKPRNCKPCADRTSPLCGLDGCELDR